MGKLSVIHVENESHTKVMYTANDVYIRGTSLKQIDVDKPTFYDHKSGIVRVNNDVHQIVLPNQRYIPVMTNVTPPSITMLNANSELYLSSNGMYYENTTQSAGYIVWKF